MAAVVAGYADLCVYGPIVHDAASLASPSLLAQMNAIGLHSFGQGDAVVDDEGDIVPRADSLQRCWRAAAASCWSIPFTRNWNAATGPADKSLSKLDRKSPANIERRNQIELAIRFGHAGFIAGGIKVCKCK
jgi:hypothetical protein